MFYYIFQQYIYEHYSSFRAIEHRRVREGLVSIPSKLAVYSTVHSSLGVDINKDYIILYYIKVYHRS